MLNLEQQHFSNVTIYRKKVSIHKGSLKNKTINRENPEGRAVNMDCPREGAGSEIYHPDPRVVTVVTIGENVH